MYQFNRKVSNQNHHKNSKHQYQQTMNKDAYINNSNLDHYPYNLSKDDYI